MSTIDSPPKLVLDLANDPLRFTHLCWPDMKLSTKQRDILESVVENLETFCHAANEMGKTRIAAVCAIYFFTSRTPARVITSSSSETQLNTILWTEMRNLIETSAFPLPFVVKNLKIEKLKDPETNETESLDYIIGHVTNVVENFQGHHLPNDKARVLCIFDEASAIPDEFFDASCSWAHRHLVIGNPLSTTNFFYRKCKAGDAKDPAGGPGLFRKVIHMSGRDSPNFQVGFEWRRQGKGGSPPILIPGLLSYEDFVRRESEWDLVKRTTRLYGKFDESDHSFLYPMEWLDRAEERFRQIDGSEREPKAMGVDVAQGRDLSVWTVVDNMGVIEQICKKTPDTMEIAGITIALMRNHGIKAKDVLFDAGGGGKQIVDRLREQGHAVKSVAFGESPTEHKKIKRKSDAADPRQAFKNRRAEMYGVLREYLDPDTTTGVFALPPEACELREELSILPLQYDSEGKMFLPPKDSRPGSNSNQPSLRSILGRSPDRADSLVLATFALSRANKRRPWRVGNNRGRD